MIKNKKINHDFKIINGFEFSLNLNYLEKTNFMNTIIKKSMVKSLKKNINLSDISSIDVPQEYSKPILNASRKHAQKVITNFVKPLFFKQYGENIEILSLEYDSAKFERDKKKKNVWLINIFLKGKYVVK